MDSDNKNQQSPENESIPESDTTQNTCLRCGTCCQKGGPCFHQEDRLLIEKGQIPSKNLYTIRKGEYAYDNVKGCLVPASSDIIKIKGQKGSWTCLFFDAGEKACSIYNDRPLECRTLKCWDTDALEQIYTRNRLTREDLILQVKGLWDLVADHQVRCDYEKIKKLINDLDGSQKGRARNNLVELIQYDAEIRKLVVAKGGLDPAMLDFIFGRPLTETLPAYGIKVRQEAEKTIISRTQLSEDR
ncbi:MAG: YkgJ family cysteine cluster protein [Desulfobacterales bacterium]